MKLLSVETTPNPNCMKFNLDQTILKPVTYTTENKDAASKHVGRLFDIEGVTSVFVCNDFLTITRDPRVDWRMIVEAATRVFEGEEQAEAGFDSQRRQNESLGQVHVFVQTFKGIPIQVKVVNPDGEERKSLGTRFNDAVQDVQSKTSSDFLKERYWADCGIRYGSPKEVAEEVADEIDGTINDESLQKLRAVAMGAAEVAVQVQCSDEMIANLRSENWHQRLSALQTLGSSEEVVPLLCEALGDANPQVRRLAAASLGASGSSLAVEPLCKAVLSDPHVGVRRTAGDALSDIGDSSAEPAVCQALADSNKLVRWRAARFLFELGSETALPSLEAAINDSEFEVRLEIEAAIQRIKGGGAGSLPAWKRMIT